MAGRPTPQTCLYLSIAQIKWCSPDQHIGPVENRSGTTTPSKPTGLYRPQVPAKNRPVSPCIYPVIITSRCAFIAFSHTEKAMSVSVPNRVGGLGRGEGWLDSVKSCRKGVSQDPYWIVEMGHNKRMIWKIALCICLNSDTSLRG